MDPSIHAKLFELAERDPTVKEWFHAFYAGRFFTFEHALVELVLVQAMLKERAQKEIFRRMQQEQRPPHYPNA